MAQLRLHAEYSSAQARDPSETAREDRLPGALPRLQSPRRTFGPGVTERTSVVGHKSGRRLHGNGH